MLTVCVLSYEDLFEMSDDFGNYLTGAIVNLPRRSRIRILGSVTQTTRTGLDVRISAIKAMSSGVPHHHRRHTLRNGGYVIHGPASGVRTGVRHSRTLRHRRLRLYRPLLLRLRRMLGGLRLGKRTVVPPRPGGRYIRLVVRSGSLSSPQLIRPEVTHVFASLRL